MMDVLAVVILAVAVAISFAIPVWLGWSLAHDNAGRVFMVLTLISFIISYCYRIPG